MPMSPAVLFQKRTEMERDGESKFRNHRYNSAASQPVVFCRYISHHIYDFLQSTFIEDVEAFVRRYL